MNDLLARLAALVVFAGLLTPATAAADSGSEHDSGETEAEPSAVESTDAGEATPDRDGPAAAPSPFRVAVGPLVAFRSMTLEGDGAQIVHNPNPYIGATMTLSGSPWTHEKLGALLSYELDLGFGTGEGGTFSAPDTDSPATRLTFAGARIFVDRRLSRHLLLGVGTGAQATAYTVEPNSLYTGHRYISVDASLRMRLVELAERFSIAAEAGVYPVFALDNSDGGHGPGTAFGARGELQLGWRIAPGASTPSLRGLRLLVRYRYQRYRGQFPTSPVGSRGGVSVDNQHMTGVMFQYALP